MNSFDNLKLNQKFIILIIIFIINYNKFTKVFVFNKMFIFLQKIINFYIHYNNNIQINYNKDKDIDFKDITGDTSGYGYYIYIE